ncbi:MAG: D-alanine--D-alanine ligase [Candidatus Komeilibacteria bacterium CG11_big_fil_rev_8_21_14_0_20_36_20]|uniref:D-alanine--D-alanine ligase n=1 Tax=Candidatus Komeilibacteria bacterium CG11_big_fil_rev_8_21_14_0_20_36_20 TaxID=1974477 RepID=A0A2H0NBA2_9BACT|nr:MAG: D-alanine--D-alanine ligase [Candidatus Komeilibacteria bacterium CG11_big_fil_rev_8_21_14_0_20_36_20]PIR81873.1 MAG: D-alanine--D-alanine ligase [Candidatus Komeilibacteria bacterium CG10_big_fil_rev_8_21_14_0_10_36_65]PJC55081.1 MAG: D-alanine--D-alanine ligase [Candidatus Komeilibacteria bacterium CG_4_9_14_0_2_um_filter_36_13]
MNYKKINIGILFGGKSAEHEVSLQSAKNIIEAIDKKKYNPILIKIDTTGKWLLADNNNQVALIPQSNGQILNLTTRKNNLVVDVVFPILHGPFGEDGTVQGLLKLANIPFVGASVLGSAIGMDKNVMKRLLRDADIPIGEFMVLKSDEKIPAYKNIRNKLGVPFFIKPANMGSSVGVYKVKDKNEYLKAIKNALKYDHKILIEEYIDGREIECAILGNSKPTASIAGEILSPHEFYSYEAKYLDEKGAVLEIPAKISGKITKQIQQLAVKTFQTLSCEGLARVDFFLKKNNDIIVNEINTLPGFTKISMYPKLWQASGISYTELINKLIQLAIEKFNRENKLKTNY